MADEQREKRSHVSRRVSDDDYSRREIRMAPLGLSVLPALRGAMERWEAICFHGLNPEQIAGYQETSQIITGNVIAVNQENAQEEEANE